MCGVLAHALRSSKFTSPMISTPESSLEYLGIHRNTETETTSPLHRPEEAILMAPDGLLGVSKRAVE